MTDLHEMKCVACRADEPTLTDSEIHICPITVSKSFSKLLYPFYGRGTGGQGGRVGKVISGSVMNSSHTK
jgi:hypothetical protein